MSSINLMERHIDRLLSEELEASSAFAAWFTRQVFGDPVPRDDPGSCSTSISYHRTAGETDILVAVEWDSGVSAEIHVEDKLGALPQPDQAQRYREAVESFKSKADFVGSVLVAPQAWMRRHPQETNLYDAAITLEDIAAQLGSRAFAFEQHANPQARELAKRLHWREALLNGSKKRQAVNEAIYSGDLTDWNTAAAEVIEAANGLKLMMSQRQQSSGRNKAGRFFKFDEKLSPDRNGKTPVLELKTFDVRQGRVSLKVAHNDSDLRVRATRAGFETAITKAGNLLIFGTTPRLKELTIAKSAAEQIDHLKDAADVAQKLIEWWEKQRL